jgi:carboxypeptidase family protein
LEGALHSGRTLYAKARSEPYAAVERLAHKPPYIHTVNGVVLRRHEIRNKLCINIKAARANGEDFLEKGLAVGAGSSRRPLEIVLSTAGARIDGSVADENNLPSAGAVVTLVPEGDHRKQFRLYMTTTTDQYGQFVLRGIAPGTYKLFSWREVEDNGWEDAEFLAPFESQGTRVTAEESGHIAIRLKSIPTETHK